MIVAMDRVYEGQGRPRKKKKPGTDLPSHYQFALWAYDNGKRYAVPVGGVRKDKRPEYPLISTTIMNEGTGTETLIWLHFDLDFKRALKKWIRDGKLDWPTIAATLAADVPIILRYLSHVVRSSGGHGLSLALAISPLELIDETTDVQKLAFKVQNMIIHILNHHGMGADEGARGLKRLMPNMFRQERVLDQADFVQALIQKKRPRVLQNLFYALRFHPALREKNKRDRDDILWPDTRVEKPLARLYTDILDEAGPWGSVQMSAGGIMRRYGIAKNTVYKLLSDPPKWLEVEALPGEGYRLTIRPVRALTDRAYDLLQNHQNTGCKPLAHMDMPENVEKGERNHWLVTIILTCKWKGIGQCELRAALDQIIKRVPGWQKSQSLTRNLGSIVRSLYHHRSSLKGKSPDQILPEWLLAALQPAKPNRLSQKIPKKGSHRDLECAQHGRQTHLVKVQSQPKERRECVDEGKGAQRNPWELPEEGENGSSMRPMRDLKEAVVKPAAQTCVNLRQAGEGGRAASNQQSPISFPPSQVLEVGEQGKLSILPEEGPSNPGRCNYDTLSPKRSSNDPMMDGGPADEAVVAVNSPADEDAGDRSEGKTGGKRQEVEVKGGTVNGT
ncbi:hypothetical protein [Oligoflexus sp.]|uniref:hypothetical protein n=1 Tax=Oligoflexus sp. TaxID=1971216 RepID=UPI002D77F175|nr:hypothetical protein [Oligoflexus sp.]